MEIDKLSCLELEISRSNNFVICATENFLMNINLFDV